MCMRTYAWKSSGRAKDLSPGTESLEACKTDTGHLVKENLH